MVTQRRLPYCWIKGSTRNPDGAELAERNPGSARKPRIPAFGLANHLQGTPCRVAGSDLTPYIEAANRFFHPDLMVVCSDPTVGDPHVETDARLAIEVLSTRTAEYDREVKGEVYRQLPGLIEYLLVAQDRPEVHCYRRTAAGWEEQRYGPGDNVPVLAGELSIAMATIYERLNGPV